MMIVHFTKPVESLQEFAAEMKQSKQSHRVIHVQSEYMGGIQVVGPDFFTWPTHELISVYQKGKSVNQAYIDLLAKNLFYTSESLGLGCPLMKISDDFTAKLSDKIQ